MLAVFAPIDRKMPAAMRPCVEVLHFHLLRDARPGRLGAHGLALSKARLPILELAALEFEIAR